MTKSQRRRAVAMSVMALPLCLVTLDAASSKPPKAPTPQGGVTPPEYIVEDAGFRFTGNTSAPDFFFPGMNVFGQVASASRTEVFGFRGAAVRPRGPRARLGAPFIRATAKGGAATKGKPEPKGGGGGIFFQATRSDSSFSFLQPLGTLSGPSGESNAYDVNANEELGVSQVVGESDAPGPDVHAFRYTDGRLPPMQDLGTLGGSYSAAFGINDSGHTVGESSDGESIRPFVFVDDGPMQQLTGLGGVNGSATDINNAGWIVGESELDNGFFHAFILSPGGGIADLGTLGGDNSAAWGVSDAAFPIVVGESELIIGLSNPRPVGIPGQLVLHAFRFDTGTEERIDLGTLPDHNWSVATSVNTQGDIVGYSQFALGSFGNPRFRFPAPSSSTRAFIWIDENGDDFSDPGEMRDLNTLIPPGTGWHLSVATDINSNGQITGYGLKDGNPAVFRLSRFVEVEEPVINSCSVTPASYDARGGTFTIDANVTDNEGVLDVIATVTPSDDPGNPFDVQLNRLGMTDDFRATFTGARNESGVDVVYDVDLRATDFDDNETTAGECGTGTVRKNAAPVIKSCTLDPTSLPVGGGLVTVSVNVNDDIGVTDVQAVVTVPSEEPAHPPIPDVVLSLTSGTVTSGTWTGSFTVPANSTASTRTYSVQTTAKDDFEDSDSEDCGDVTVAADAPPVIDEETCEVSPETLPSTGGSVTISVRITDDVGVSSAGASISGPQIVPGVTLSLQSGTAQDGIWEGSFSAPPNTGMSSEVYDVDVNATDTIGLTDSDECGSVTVQPIENQDEVPPAILSCSIDPIFMPNTGGDLTIRAEVVDDLGLTSVVARITRPNGSSTNVTMDRQGASDDFLGVFAVPANKSLDPVFYSVLVIATDGGNNTDEEECGILRVAAADESDPTRVSVEPRTLNFGKVKINTTKTLNLTVKHAGGGEPGSLLVFRIGGLQAPYEFLGGASSAGESAGNIEVAAGGKRTFKVKFSPTALGTFNDQVIVLTNDPDQPIVFVNVTGKGCQVKH
jgi:probable HAF family extracellular repeat protein